jgi:hypothetical protein
MTRSCCTQTQEGASEDVSEPATLILRRANFELRRNNGRKVLVNEKYGPDVSVCLSPQLLSTSLSAISSLFLWQILWLRNEAVYH